MSDEYEFPYFSTNMNTAEKVVYDSFCYLPTVKLFEEFDKVLDENIIKDRVKYDVLRGIISDRFGLVYRDWFGPIFAVELNEMEKRISILEDKFKNHRHDKHKTYTSKPEW